jgi:hypothetical protein
MPENNISNLNEDIVKSTYGLSVSNTDVVAATSLTLLSSSANLSPSNAGTNAINNTSQTLTVADNVQNAEGKLIANLQGNVASGGVLTTKNTTNLPNIFFNFRNKTFKNNGDLLFKFETSNLNNTNFTGIKLPTWNANADVRPNISLTNAANPLSVVKAYDKYFYQLDRYQNISNVISLPIKTNPSYTVFVFAVGKEAGAVDINNINQANILHTFCDNNNTNSSLDNYNIGGISYQKPGIKGSSASNYGAAPTASFVGNTLNSNKYSNADARIEYDNYVNIYNKYFYEGFGQSTNPSFNYFLSTKQINTQKYAALGFSNIAQTPFVLNTKNTSGGDVNINLNYFSLHFVEMFSYIDGSNADYNILRLQTFVNGLLTYDGSTQLKKTIGIDSSGNFKIRLSNNYAGYNTDANIKLFLFDYIHGVSNSSVQTMKQTSRNIVESLAYDYRNIILKSTTDIQLSSSASASTLLPFSPLLIHPFLKLFFK